MTGSVLPPLVIAAAGGLLLALMWRLGALIPPPVAAWNRVARHYGLLDDRPLTERLGERAPSIRRLDQAFNIPRLLAVSGRRQSAASWLLGNLALALLLVLVALVLELVGLAALGRLPVPLVYCLAYGLVAFLVRYLLLRIAAQRRQTGLERGLSEALTELAILTYTRQMPIDQAVELLARAQSDGYLWGLLKDENWQELAAQEPPRHWPQARSHPNPSTAAIYDRIGQTYQVPMFSLLAANLRRMGEKGQDPRRVLTNLARSVGKNRLAEMHVASERSRFRQAVPLGLMIAPLLLLIGYPAWVSFSRAFH